MTKSAIACCASIILLSTQVVHAQEERMRYRQFPLGSDLASVTKEIAASPSDVRVIHQRPAMIQELEWRPRYYSRGTASQTDPVDLIAFSFFNDQLFRVVVDYDPHRTEGMSEADLINAIAVEYGPASRVMPTSTRPSRLDYGAADTSLAIWTDEAATATLLRVAYPVSYRLVVADTRLEALAKTASAEAVRLDVKEAPQREIARQKKASEEAAAALDKAKTANKAVFRP